MGYKRKSLGRVTQILEQDMETAINKAKRKYFDEFYIFDLGDGYYSAEGFDLYNTSIIKYKNVTKGDDRKKWEII